ncbi:MAG: tail fiber domain-containing protein [Bacteroidetes bacterium]|nr:tail fiber domain-containing protein [Bacteroidota bacterium]
MSNANRTIDLAGTQILKAADGTAAAPSITNDGDTNTGMFFPAADTIAFSEGGVESMRIDSSGRVGIGTTSPQKELQINATEPTIRLEESGAGSKRLELSVNSAAEAKIFANQSGGNLILGTVGTERLRIDSSGNVGIGTISPDAKLAIDASGASTPTAPISCNATSGAGNRYAALFRYSGTLSGSVTVNGASASYNTSSDYRLKTNLEPISNGIERIKQLPVYRFNWKTNENGNKVDGFVAHEAQPIVPEAIVGTKDEIDADGNPIYQGIDQSKIVPLLTAALKEAIAKIEVLESKVAALEAA